MAATAAIAGIAGTAIGAGSTIYNDVAGGGSAGGYYSGSAPPPAYIPQAQPWADQSYQNLVNQMMPYAQQIPGQVLPAAGHAFGNVQANPYAAGAQGGANFASQYAQGPLFGAQMGAAGAMGGAGMAGIPYASQILQTGFDPQGALYNRTQQQLQDQMAANLSMGGLAGTPYGAGLMNQGMSNFNIDWQNAQLGRQAQAASGYGSLISGAGRGLAGGLDFATQPLTTIPGATGLPYSTYAGQQGDVLSAAGQYAGLGPQAFGLGGQGLNALSTYMGLGQAGTQIGQAGAAQQAALNRQQGQDIGQAFAAFGQLGPSINQLFAPKPDPWQSYNYSQSPETAIYGSPFEYGYSGY